MTHPTAEHTILPTIVLLCAAPQLAQAQVPSSLSGLFACEALTAPDAQLACFRAETAKLRAWEGVAAPMAAPMTAPRTPTVERAAPEFAPMAEKKTKAAKSQTLAIRSTTKTAKGYYVFTLENGEVWQQIESARVRVGKGSPDMLTIKRKSFGSFLGSVNGKRPSFRVRRVK